MRTVPVSLLAIYFLTMLYSCGLEKNVNYKVRLQDKQSGWVNVYNDSIYSCGINNNFSDDTNSFTIQLAFFSKKPHIIKISNLQCSFDSALVKNKKIATGWISDYETHIVATPFVALHSDFNALSPGLRRITDTVRKYSIHIRDMTDEVIMRKKATQIFMHISFEVDEGKDYLWKIDRTFTRYKKTEYSFRMD
jgi:hypothetical protein